MREAVDSNRLDALMRALGRVARVPAQVYLTGGASAVLVGWRSSTIDVDLAFVPDADDVLRAIPRLKNELRINVELAAPSDFIPAVPGWRERSVFVRQEGLLAFHHYDFYSQALAKIERGHALDRQDVAAMLERSLVVPQRLRELFSAIQPELYRYPAIDAAAFTRAVDAALRT